MAAEASDNTKPINMVGLIAAYMEQEGIKEIEVSPQTLASLKNPKICVRINDKGNMVLRKIND